MVEVVVHSLENIASTNQKHMLCISDGSNFKHVACKTTSIKWCLSTCGVFSVSKVVFSAPLGCYKLS